MRVPSEWDKAAKKEGELDELKRVLAEKEREVEAHRILEKGLDARIEFLEDKVLTQKVELEDAEKTIKRLKGDEFTNTIRRNQEGTLMRITSFLNGALINGIEEDKVRERVGDRKLTIDQRLEALMGEMSRVREEAHRSHKEAMDLRSRLKSSEILCLRAEKASREAGHLILQIFRCFFSTVENPEVDGFIPTVDRLQQYVQEKHKDVLRSENCDHNWQRRRDGRTCHKCGKLEFGFSAGG